MATIAQQFTYPDPEPTSSKADQSRINGAKSRGPVTEEGKAKSSQNARKHGLTAKHSLVDPEDALEYLRHHNSMIADLKPQDAVEQMLADQVAMCSWKLRQAHNIEIDLMRDNLDAGDSLHNAFTQNELSMMRLSRYQTAIERSMYRALNELRKRQAASQQSKNCKTNPAPTGLPSLEEIRAEMRRRGLKSCDPSVNPDATTSESQPAREERREPQNDETNPEFEPKSTKTNPRGPGTGDGEITHPATSPKSSVPNP